MPKNPPKIHGKNLLKIPCGQKSSKVAKIFYDFLNKKPAKKPK
jgi:hypothetical protein